MNDTAKLLTECCTGCKYATNNLEQVREYAKSEALKDLITKYNDKHIAYGDECHVKLQEAGGKEEDPNAIAAAMAKLGNSLKLTANPDTAHIASLLADGCHMGIKSLAKFKNRYKDASDEAKDTAQELIDLESDMLTELLPLL